MPQKERRRPAEASSWKGLSLPMARPFAYGRRVSARVCADPVHDARGDVDPMARSAVDDEQMGAARVTDELGLRLAAGKERGEELLALPDRAAVVCLAVDDERRYRHAVDVRERREAAERLAIARVLRAQLPRGEPHPDIRRAVEALLVDHRRPDYGRLEPVAVPDGPRGHESTVRIARDREPLRIRRAVRDERVDRGELFR